MRRTNLVYGGLLALALVVSYLSWTGGPDTTSEKGVVLVDAKVEDIESIHYVADDVDALLTAGEDEAGRHLWAKVIAAPPAKPKKPDAHAGEEEGDTGEATDADEEPAEGEKKLEEFLVGPAGDKLLEKLAPLRAKRALEELDEEKLSELGLSGSAAMLTLQVEGRDPVIFDVAENEFGSAIAYLRDQQTGVVYVVEAELLRPLQKAGQRLPNRALFPGKTKDVASATIAAEDRSVVLEHKNREDEEKQFWAAAGADEASDTVQAWLQKLFRLQATRYVQAGEDPSDLAPRFSVRLEHADGKATNVEILGGKKPDGSAGFYARSEHTRGLVELPAAAAEEAAQDVGAVLD